MTLNGLVVKDMILDRSQPTPLHHQVRQYLWDRVRSGDWPVGFQIPPEHVLCDLLGVSRATVIRALTELTRQGVLERRQGRGTFVQSPRLNHGPLVLKSFTQEHADSGLRSAAIVLELGEKEADEHVAQALEIETGSRVLCLRRLRYAGSDTMGIQEAFLPKRLIPSLASVASDLAGSLYEVLAREYGITPFSARETFEPARLSKSESLLLKCDPATLAFLVERTTATRDGVPFEFVRSKMRGDRYRYTMQLQSPV